MTAPINPSPKPTVAVPITATAAATPTEVASIVRGRRATLSGITASNVTAKGTSVREQVFVGVRKQGDTGATWEVIVAPILFDGEWVKWEGEVQLAELDEVVAYASAASKINVLLEYLEGK